jgi:hypothetical protein
VTYKPLPIEPCTLVKEFQLAQCTIMAEVSFLLHNLRFNAKISLSFMQYFRVIMIFGREL